jgi:hypothetical protein
MSDGMTVRYKMHFRRSRRSRKQMRKGEQPPPAPASRIPRISRLMALAIRLNQLIRDGVVADQAELARLSHVTRARMTQIMNLLNLAPDIQEEILFLGPVSQGRDPAWERRIRPIASLPDWYLQRRIWDEMSHAPTIRRGTVGDSSRDRIRVAGCLTPN